MRPLPPPPPVPSGVEPRTATPVKGQMAVPSPQKAAPEAASTPEEFAKMLDFVNEVRRLRGLEAVAALPDPTGDRAAERPLSKALGCSVIKHRDGGPFYALVYDEQTMKALVAAGASGFSSYPRIWGDETTKMWEMRIPTYLKPFA